MITNYQNKGGVRGGGIDLCVCIVIVGKKRWTDPVPKCWTKAEVLADMQQTWGKGHLTETTNGWEYVTDDPNATEAAR